MSDGPLEQIERRGFAVVPGALSADQVQAVREALAPFHGARQFGRNDFEGYRTERVYSLLARGAIFADLAVQPAVLAVCDALLQVNYLLSAALSINIHPGETAQDIHFDDSFYPLPRPRPPVGVSVIWAIDDFTAENGATQVIPGSHLWGDEVPDGAPDDPAIRPRRGRDLAPRDRNELLAPLLVDMEMASGSALVFPSTLWHRGGANRSERARLGLTTQYCQPWARQQENMMLAVPRSVTKALPGRVRELMGYSIHPPFMGHIDSMHPGRILQD